jgi:biopolymer transport protein ExbB
VSVIWELLAAAGIVAPVLAVCTVVLWYALGTRWQTLRGLDAQALDRALDRQGEGTTLLDAAVVACRQVRTRRRTPLRAHYEEAVEPLRELADAHATIVRSVVAIAPLAGLLGTVTGMIETFDSLGTMSLFTRNGGIGAGISEAMVSTQMGLVVAVPGLLFGGVLDRQQDLAETSLDRLTDMMSGGTA